MFSCVQPRFVQCLKHSLVKVFPHCSVIFHPLFLYYFFLKFDLIHFFNLLLLKMCFSWNVLFKGLVCPWCSILKLTQSSRDVFSLITFEGLLTEIIHICGNCFCKENYKYVRRTVLVKTRCHNVVKCFFVYVTCIFI